MHTHAYVLGQNKGLECPLNSGIYIPSIILLYILIHFTVFSYSCGLMNTLHGTQTITVVYNTLSYHQKLCGFLISFWKTGNYLNI